VSINQYADLTTQEYNALLNGYSSSLDTRVQSTNSPTDTVSSVTSLPSSVDWRTLGYVTPVKDQGQCGSCWAFSATGALEGQHFKVNKSLVSLSEQNLVDCSTSNYGCNGGSMNLAFLYIQNNKGIDTEASYPYTAQNGACKFSASAVGATDKGYSKVTSGSESALQTAVANIGPISVAIDASQQSFQVVLNNHSCSII